MSTEIVTPPAAPAVAASPKKSKARKAKATKPAPSKPKSDRKAAAHPPALVMVLEAVGKLNERKGSSLRAIKKFITDVFKVDANKLAPFIRKAIVKLVQTGKLTQNKGTGATGSFKLASKDTTTVAKIADAKPKAAPKKAAAAKPKLPAAVTVKKPAVAPPKPTDRLKKPVSPKKAPPAAKKLPVKAPKTMTTKAPAKPKTGPTKAAPKTQ